MDRQQQHMLDLADLHNWRAQQWATLEIEGTIGLVTHDLRQRCFSFSLGQRLDRYHIQRNFQRRRNHLHGLAKLLGYALSEGCAQGLMSLRNRRQATSKSLQIERSVQSRYRQQVI